MAKLSIIGGAAVIACSAAIPILGAGTAAAAPDVVGQKYSDAVSAIEGAGGTVKVGVRVGGSLPQDDCIVTSATDASYTRPGTSDVYYEKASDEVVLALNCNGGYATANHPGNSVGSPQGRDAKDEEESIKWRSENPDWCAKTLKQHPDWELEGC